MTSFWRTLVLILAGFGAAWAVTRVGGVPPTVFNSLDDAAPAGAAEQGPPPAPTIGQAEPPTQAEIEDQIRRAEEALGDRADPDEELPVDPLRADVAISLPSDI